MLARSRRMWKGSRVIEYEINMTSEIGKLMSESESRPKGLRLMV